MGPGPDAAICASSVTALAHGRSNGAVTCGAGLRAEPRLSLCELWLKSPSASQRVRQLLLLSHAAWREVDGPKLVYVRQLACAVIPVRQGKNILVPTSLQA